MPLYDYECETCDCTKTVVTASVHEEVVVPTCDSAGCENAAMGRIYGQRAQFKAAYDKPVLSRTLGIPNKKQRAAMMRRFPDREYLPDGRLVMRSHQERNRILKEEKMVDLDGFN